jgi:hypothetical protein
VVGFCPLYKILGGGVFTGGVLSYICFYHMQIDTSHFGINKHHIDMITKHGRKASVTVLIPTKNDKQILVVTSGVSPELII